MMRYRLPSLFIPKGRKGMRLLMKNGPFSLQALFVLIAISQGIVPKNAGSIGEIIRIMKPITVQMVLEEVKVYLSIDLEPMWETREVLITV